MSENSGVSRGTTSSWARAMEDGWRRVIHLRYTPVVNRQTLHPIFLSPNKLYLYSPNTKLFMETIFLIGMPSGWEWFIIGLFVLVFFGAKKIPEFAKGLGKGIREFKDAVKDVKKEVDDAGKEVPKIDEK